MYYLAAINSDGIERASDFGFNMVERIMLDECFKSLKKVPSGLIIEKRFCIYEDKPVFNRRKIIGTHAAEIYSRFGIYIGYDTCVATVLDKSCLKLVLQKLWMKIHNLRDWHCNNCPEVYGMFDNILVYDPYIMRKMLSEKKYGLWNHGQDRNRSLQVLEKFINFLEDNTDNDAIVLYNELFCSRWDAKGEIYFDINGLVTEYKYFGEGKAFSYIYTPKIDIWQRV